MMCYPRVLVRGCVSSFHAFSFALATAGVGTVLLYSQVVIWFDFWLSKNFSLLVGGGGGGDCNKITNPWKRNAFMVNLMMIC